MRNSHSPTHIVLVIEVGGCKTETENIKVKPELLAVRARFEVQVLQQARRLVLRTHKVPLFHALLLSMDAFGRVLGKIADKILLKGNQAVEPRRVAQKVCLQTPSPRPY